jgi:hypothetical protein
MAGFLGIIRKPHNNLLDFKKWDSYELKPDSPF